MILSGDIDLAFMVLPDRHQDITYEVLSEEELMLIMSPEHSLAKEGITKEGCKYPWMDMAKLKDEQFILQWPDQRTRQTTDKIFRDVGIKPNIILTIRNIYAAVELAADNYGLTFVSEAPFRYIQTRVRPLCFSVGNPNTIFNLTAAYHRNVYLPLYTQEFINILKVSI